MKKKIFVTISLIIVLINCIVITSNAAMPIDTAYIYANKKTDGLLMWNGLGIHTHMSVYEKDGKEYPAYCLNRELPGVEVGFSQTVDVNKLINNVMVWRAIVNGYPYKSISELGCVSEEEAYLATKQAVYCMLTNRDVNEYSAIGESGERTLNALKQIVSNARNSNITKVSSDLKINQKESLWKIDTLDNKYVSQQFTVTANAGFSEYTVDLEETKVEGIRITDINNNDKKDFKSNEEFKILMPITNIIEDGNFVVKVSGEVATKPVLFGATRDINLQNYALTGYTYENGTGSQKIYYTKNNTEIVIIKKDEKDEKRLEGVKFELLDNNQNVLFTDLVTDKNGEVKIENLLPGTYYIKEIKTLEGYQIYDKLIKVEIDLNELTKVNVINSEKMPEIKIENRESEITVESKKEEISVLESNKTQSIKLPKTGM